jgi:threonine/homoserine/homoserine lactone efflux protein
MHAIAVSLTTYAVAAALLTITPGLDTALVLRTAAAEGPHRALWAGLGIATGCIAWTVLVAAGLGALLVASERAYTVLRWAGAIYLLYLGLHLLLNPRTRFSEVLVQSGPSGNAFARGALTNLLNPKVGIFYVSFLPQFIPPGVAVAPYTLLLGVIHATLGLVWFACLISATRPLLAWLRRPAVLRALDRVTGGIFIAFGVRLATISNTR